MIIRTIQPLGSRGERVELHLEDEHRSILLAREIAMREGLREGMDLPEQKLRLLEEEDLAWRAREAALHLLSYRARSRAELARRLMRKGFPEALVESCLADLTSRGFIDDGAFAASFARDRIRGKPKGPRRISQELRSLGVSPDLAGTAIEEAMQDADLSDLDLARKAAAKWRERSGEEPARARRRLYAFLMRRGFTAEVALAVLRERIEGEDETD
jgi:regulatory protein